MNVHDIEEKQDNELKKRLISMLGLDTNETISAAEINAIVEALKNKPTDPIWIGDPLEEYISHRNE